MRSVRSVVLLAFAGSMAVGAVAQQTGWVVKPEWVRAHEEFLASDVMQGRGSATRDEEITATYVASEFMAYGLKTAPGMSGYLQAAEISSPLLDGHARLTSGDVKLDEGAGFVLLQSGGTGASGLLVKVRGGEIASAKFARGAVVLVTDVPDGKTSIQMARVLQRGGAAMILVPSDPSTETMYTMSGGKTRVPIRLKEQEAGRGGATMVAVSAEAAAKLAKDADGTVVSLDVKTAKEEKPRATYNAIGYLEGSDPKAGTILLTAHLDHLGVGRAVNGDAIYNGANDDAAGTTAVLELAHALAAGPKLKRSVLFVCYGSEEAGELGSTYFGKHSPVPLKDLVTNLEFEMIGNQDPKMPKGVLLLTGWERSNLGPTLKAHGALLGPDPYPEEHFFERSDNYALALQGVVAHTAAGWGTPPTYHQPSDDLAHLDVPFMTSAIQSLVEPVRWLADSDFKPEWVAGGRPKGRE
jgi:hypothetical protein